MPMVYVKSQRLYLENMLTPILSVCTLAYHIGVLYAKRKFSPYGLLNSVRFDENLYGKSLMKHNEYSGILSALCRFLIMDG
jgi:hypothetical protein